MQISNQYSRINPPGQSDLLTKTPQQAIIVCCLYSIGCDCGPGQLRSGQRVARLIVKCEPTQIGGQQ